MEGRVLTGRRKGRDPEPSGSGLYRGIRGSRGCQVFRAFGAVGP